MIKKYTNKKLKTMIENSLDYIVLLDSHANIEFINRTYTGRPASEIIGTNMFSYFPPAQAATLKKAIDQVTKTGIQQTSELIFITPEGLEIVLFCRVQQVVFQKDQMNVIISATDITESKAFEEKLTRANEELEIRVQERTNELEKKNIALTEILSHLEIEKQNVASRVDLNVQKLLLPIVDKLMEKAVSVDERYLRLLRQNLDDMTSSMGEKISSGKFQLTPKEIELCTLIKGGFSIKEIATMQNLSVRTVETHRFNIRKKLGINSKKVNLSSHLSQF